MISLFDWLFQLLPLVIVGGWGFVWVHAFLARAPRTDGLFPLVNSVSLFACLAALAVLAKVAVSGGWTISLGSVLWLPLIIKLDVLSALMLALCSLVGAICLRYSRSYLDGDPRQADFIAQMIATLISVSLLVLSGSLLVLWLAWVAVSLTLNKLLVFFQDRPAAQAAARKRRMVARAGDVLLLAGFTALLAASGTSDIGDISRWAADAAGGAWLAVLAAGCIAMAAALKSAQMPSHSWLTEVMETPTPVSALLHAGIVNAGGFLLLRFADVLLLSPDVMIALAVLGGVTALTASAVMLFQTAIKTGLAWSTIAQMGFMIMQCGLGAFSLAALHIVAHSFYKAHAFLSSGSAIDTGAMFKLAGRGKPVEPALRGGLIAGLSLAALAAMLLLSGDGLGAAELLFGFVLIIGLVQFTLDEASLEFDAVLLARLAGSTVLLTGSYLLVHGAMDALMARLLPSALPAGGALLAVVLGGGFLALAVARGWLSRAGGGAWRVHLANGFYIGALFDRLAGSYRQRSA